MEIEALMTKVHRKQKVFSMPASFPSLDKKVLFLGSSENEDNRTLHWLLTLLATDFVHTILHNISQSFHTHIWDTLIWTKLYGQFVVSSNVVQRKSPKSEISMLLIGF